MRRRVAVAVALPVAAAGAVAAVVAVGGGGAEPGRAASGGGRHGTEVVERRTLVERETVDGTLGYGDPRPALDRVGGTLTWLPDAGAVIRPGERLFAVDDLPVVLMDGSVPAWRALEAGMSDGSDVLQLERNLAALGHEPGTVDDQFTSATAAAVERWQEANDLPETGRVELGRVVFLPGPRRIAAVTGMLGSSGGGGAGGGGGASDVAWDGGDAGVRTAGWDGGARFVPVSDSGGATTPAEPPATTPTTPSTTPTTPTTTPTTPSEAPPSKTTPAERPPTRTTPSEPKGAPPGGGPSSSGGSPVGGGSGSPGGSGGGDGGTGGGDGGPGGGGAGTEVLETTSTERVVTAELDAADQALARVGRAATVTLPSGRTVRGRIVEVGTVATGSGDDEGGGAGGGSGDGSATLPVTIRLRSARGAGGLDEAPVSVALARTTRRNVLAVPVQALLARSGGGYAVRVAGRGTTGGSAEVRVEPGLYADGWVELLGGAVQAGDRVEVPR